MSGSQLNAVAFTTFLPGARLTAHNGGQTNPGILTVDSYRLNWGVGINCLHQFNNKLFGMLMVGGGITKYHAKMEAIETLGKEPRAATRLLFCVQ